jgi:transcriptional regulator with XRE-family HTH domain
VVPVGDGAGVEIGRFLRARRARLTPAELGLAVPAGRRRVPGLRREELARLAGVSPDYYVRLEQGRATGVSDEVLRAIGRALRLNGLEQAHLARLAREPRGGGPRPDDVVDGDVRRLLDAMTGLPAHVIGRRTDVIAWNAAADAVFQYGDRSTPPNIARRLFTDPDSRVRYPNWAELAAPVVTRLQLERGEFPDDTELAELVTELVDADADFRRLWTGQHIAPNPSGTMLVRHPVAGDLSFDYQLLAFPQSPAQTAFVAVPTGRTAAALRDLLDARGTGSAAGGAPR